MTDAEWQLWLETPGKLRCALFKLQFVGRDMPEDSQGLFNVYISNMPYVTDGDESPGDKIFEECVIECPAFTESMGEQLEGRSTQSYADLIYSNETTLDANGDQSVGGVRDSWLSMNWDGRRIEQWLGDPSWRFADFRKVLDGILVDVFDPGGYKGGFHISDKSALLDRPVMTTLLGGDGPEAGGLMPLALGYELFNITPKLTDITNHIYRVSAVDDGAEGLYKPTTYFETYDVRENGVSLINTVRSVDSVDAANNLITVAGHGYSANTRLRFPSGTPPAPLGTNIDLWVIASGLTDDDFKLSATLGGSEINITGSDVGANIYSYGWTILEATGSLQIAGNPVGLITATVYGLVDNPTYTAGDSSAAGIAIRVLTSALTNTPFTSADIDAANLATFSGYVSTRLAIWLTETIAFADLLDRLVLSVGGWWGFSDVGELVMGQLVLPVVDTPVYSFIADDVALRSLKLVRRILPRVGIKLRGLRNWTVQQTVSSSVTEYNRALYATEWSEKTGAATVTTWDTDPANHRRASRPNPEDTLIFSAADLQSEADRVTTMFQYPTGIFGFDTHHAAYLMHRGDLIYMEHPKYTGYGIVTTVTKRVKGRSHVEFFCQHPDVYPEADIA